MSASSRKNMGRTKGNHQRYSYAEQLWESSLKFVGSKYKSYIVYLDNFSLIFLQC